ncbi:MAG: MFS transporter [Nitriliruptoraceae bacterium]
MTQPPTVRFRSLVSTSAAAVVMSTLPFFLAGSLAHEFRAEFGFSLVEVGLMSSAFFGMMALSGIPIGRAVDRVPARVALLTAVGLATISLAAIPTVATTFPVLAGILALAGAANAISEATTNRLLSEAIPPHQLASAVSFKQAAPAFASTLTGLALPSVVFFFGWRANYLLGVVAGLVLMILLVRSRRVPLGHGRRAASGPLRRPGPVALLVLTLAGGFGASSAVLAFFVESRVSGGWSAGAAGWVLAAASTAAIVARLFSGVVVDRTRLDGLGLTAILIGTGSVGFVLLSFEAPAVVASGAILALGGTWGFAGVFFSAVIQNFPRSAGRVTGVVQIGAAGAVAFPAAFGAIAERFGYAPAWWSAAVLALFAATLAFSARQMLRRALVDASGAAAVTTDARDSG